jgi:hypothetical protein
MHSTHREEFQGISPTGERVEVRVIGVFHVSDINIVEHWGHTYDRLPPCPRVLMSVRESRFSKVLCSY